MNLVGRNWLLLAFGIIIFGGVGFALTTISDDGISTTGDVTFAGDLNVSGTIFADSMRIRKGNSIFLAGATFSRFNFEFSGVNFTGVNIDDNFAVNINKSGSATLSASNFRGDNTSTSIISGFNGVRSMSLFKFSPTFSTPHLGAVTNTGGKMKILGWTESNDSLSGIQFGFHNSTLLDVELQVTGFRNETIVMEIFNHSVNIFIDLNITDNLFVGNQITILGGSPASGRVLTSDANGLGSWILPAGGGWTDGGANIFLTNINDDVGVGQGVPDSKFHVTDGGSAGSVTAIANTIATFESPGTGYISLLTPDASERGIFFGETSDNNAGGIIYNDAATLDGLQFRVNGNNIVMSITGAGDLSFPSDLDLTTGTGGVFKFVDNAFQSGLDSSNYLEVGHGGSNSFLNQVGAGGMDFRFGGVTKATFTDAGHLHLMTDTDQKHTLKIITANNAQDTGIAFENSGGSFTATMFRTDVGSNRADLVFAAGLNSDIDLLTNSFRIHGEASDEGNVEFFQDVGIGTASPSSKLEVNGSLTVDNNTLFVNSANSRVGINTITPNAELDIRGAGGVSVGGFPSGALHVTSPSTAEFRNAVITGHSSFNGNTQLWYLGSTSSSNNNVAFINRQAGEIHLHTNDLRVMTIDVDGNIDIDRGNLTLQDKITFRLGETIDNLVDGWLRITGSVNVTGDLEVAGNLTVDRITDNTIFAQLSSSVDQLPSNVSSVPITYDTQDSINGLNHSTSTNPSEITILVAGMYFISPQPQVGKDMGAISETFDMYLQVDRGAGFVNEANSNIKLSIKDQDLTDVIVSAFTISLDADDKIRMMQKVSDAGVGMGLIVTNATAEVPRTPSIIFTMYRVGGQAL